MSKLAGELRHWRTTFDLTQFEAAQLLHVSSGHLGRIERGRHLPPLSEERRMHSIINAMFLGAEMQKEWCPL